MEAAVVNNNKPGRVHRSWELVKSSWRILSLDKELLTLPIIGMALSFAIILATAILFVISVVFDWGIFKVTHGVNGNSSEFAKGHLDWIAAIIVALAFIGISFVSNFIAVAISKGALDRFKGQDPTVKSSLQAAKARAGSIFKFSLLSLTVGLILQIIQDRVPFAGKILTFLGKFLWGVATFFVIPIIAMSDKPVGPVDATKQSTGIIKKVWGESLIVNIGVGLIALLSFIVYIPGAVVLSALVGNLYLPLGIFLGIVSVLGFFALILIFSVLSAIVRTAIYYWATTGEAPEKFDKELLRASLTQRKARKIFA